ncbi:hypothetical protein XELAEV_18020121mg [Xenopus laevis]|uniref:Uncharacterized protein n=1 Tax=Xenopus laevis TaxID=8355 RepID=A0A974D6B4_XENLA|nr:hypothetical protein XELAEV_18020121mg [Xenopus laevis]
MGVCRIWLGIMRAISPPLPKIVKIYITRNTIKRTGSNSGSFGIPSNKKNISKDWFVSILLKCLKCKVL